MTPSPGIEPGPHWWEACFGGQCSTTAPSLLIIYNRWVGGGGGGLGGSCAPLVELAGGVPPDRAELCYVSMNVNSTGFRYVKYEIKMAV